MMINIKDKLYSDEIYKRIYRNMPDMYDHIWHVLLLDIEQQFSVAIVSHHYMYFREGLKIIK